MDTTITRLEYKFLLSKEEYEEVLPEIMMRLPGDRNAVGAEYPIVTEYFDNPWRDCYWERIRGLANRRKLRVRIYGSANGLIPPKAFAEVKHKAYGRGAKRRFDLPVDDVMSRDFDLAEVLRREAPNRGHEERFTAEEIIRLMEERNMRPVCQMRYTRHAFEGVSEDDVRVTFDHGIKCRMNLLPLYPDCQGFEYEALPPGACMMEVKMNHVVPYWMRELIGRYHLVCRQYSKYCTALETHGIELPDLVRARTALPALATA